MLVRALVTLVLISACSSPSPPPEVISPDSGTPDAGSVDAGNTELAITWTSCALHTNDAERADCGTVTVPLRWGSADTRTITLSLRRYRPALTNSRGQLWFLQGGPGASSPYYEAIGPYLARNGVQLDFYFLDQRGTGASTRLSCPGQEATASDGGVSITPDEWPACLEHLDSTWSDGGLDGFSVTDTALDLQQLITATRTPNSQVFVYGVSYGTYLLNRYLQLAPTQPTGVIFDSICGPDVCRSSQSDARFQVVAQQLFTACGNDPICSSKLGSDPWTRFASVLDGLDHGACPAATAAGLNRDSLRSAFAQLLYTRDRRPLIFALIHRLERCGRGDEPVFRNFGALLQTPPSASSLSSFSTVLANHVSLSELWDEPGPSLATLQSEESARLISVGLGAKLGALHDRWPRTPHDAHWNTWATTSTPALMINGTLDPATPLIIQDSARAAFSGPHQSFVPFPGIGHGVLGNVPATAANTLSCDVSLLISFLADPQAPVNTGCTSALPPVTFDRSNSVAGYFGTTNLWGD